MGENRSFAPTFYWVPEGVTGTQVLCWSTRAGPDRTWMAEVGEPEGIAAFASCADEAVARMWLANRLQEIWDQGKRDAAAGVLSRERREYEILRAAIYRDKPEAGGEL